MNALLLRLKRGVLSAGLVLTDSGQGQLARSNRNSTRDVPSSVSAEWVLYEETIFVEIGVDMPKL
jgi:hypothetical protein